MRYRVLGRSGITVSEIGVDGAPAGLRRYVDTASSYGDALTPARVDANRATADDLGARIDIDRPHAWHGDQAE
jgi:hypothetical protein